MEGAKSPTAMLCLTLKSFWGPLKKAPERIYTPAGVVEQVKGVSYSLKHFLGKEPEMKKHEDDVDTRRGCISACVTINVSTHQQTGGRHGCIFF